MVDGFMARPATLIRLSEHERQQLTYWVKRPRTEARYAERARIILWASQGRSNVEIAGRLETRLARVSKWRTRFYSERLAGLADSPRLGKVPKYDETTRQRILTQLDQAPPKGFIRWDGGLLAKALGDVSKYQVWRELRALGISLARQRSWCVSTDPEFTAKAAEIVALYLAPPQDAIVLAVDENRASKPWSGRRAGFDCPAVEL